MGSYFRGKETNFEADQSASVIGRPSPDRLRPRLCQVSTRVFTLGFSFLFFDFVSVSKSDFVLACRSWLSCCLETKRLVILMEAAPAALLLPPSAPSPSPSPQARQERAMDGLVKFHLSCSPHCGSLLQPAFQLFYFSKARALSSYRRHRFLFYFHVL